MQLSSPWPLAPSLYAVKRRRSMMMWTLGLVLVLVSLVMLVTPSVGLVSAIGSDFTLPSVSVSNGLPPNAFSPQPHDDGSGTEAGPGSGQSAHTGLSSASSLRQHGGVSRLRVLFILADEGLRGSSWMRGVHMAQAFRKLRSTGPVSSISAPIDNSRRTTPDKRQPAASTGPDESANPLASSVVDVELLSVAEYKRHYCDTEWWTTLPASLERVVAVFIKIHDHPAFEMLVTCVQRNARGRAVADVVDDWTSSMSRRTVLDAIIFGTESHARLSAFSTGNMRHACIIPHHHSNFEHLQVNATRPLRVVGTSSGPSQALGSHERAAVERWCAANGVQYRQHVFVEHMVNSDGSRMAWWRAAWLWLRAKLTGTLVTRLGDIVRAQSDRVSRNRCGKAY